MSGTTAAKESKAKRFGPALLLALPFLVTLVPEAVGCAFSPERIEVWVVAIPAGLVDRDTAYVNAD